MRQSPMKITLKQWNSPNGTFKSDIAGAECNLKREKWDLKNFHSVFLSFLQT